LHPNSLIECSSFFLDWAIDAHEGTEIEDQGATTATNLKLDPLGTQLDECEPVKEPEIEPVLDVIEPLNDYELVLQHRRQRFNSIEVLKELEFPKGGKARIDVPLCRMKSLQVVRPALINDILKLQADFVHGYWDGAAVFYISLKDEHGNGSFVTDTERQMWDPHWQQRDSEFESFLKADNELEFMSGRFLYVWDGNHRLLAWTDHIDKVHRGELDWHYKVWSITLQTRDSITDALTSMHDINKSTENSHVKSNLVHTLHWIQTVGRLDLSEFQKYLGHDDYEAAKVENTKADKRTWYRLPRSRFLEYLHSVCSQLQTSYLEWFTCIA
jgi:hypothetical protein